ncbi:MAG: hypothetical protein IT381_28030 [Deltaproteobacteria bacterium]|nr:hypothetical protein [Deltaproteobacteria bacterium]
MTTILSFENSPRLSVPLPFHLTAAAFGVAAGVWLATSPQAWDGNRWSPSILSLTHLVTLGVLGHGMVGSLLQLLPVIAGATVAGGRTTAWATLAGMSTGTVLLVAGLARGTAALLVAGGAVLIVALLAIASLTAAAAWRGTEADATRRALRLAPLSLGAVALLGTLLVAIMGLGAPLPLLNVLHLHVAWGAVGWVCMLIIGVGFTVVPMFQVTPPYPEQVARSWAPVIAATLVALAAALAFSSAWAAWLDAVLALIVLGGAGSTLFVQHKSRRPHDVTRRFWQGSMMSWTLAAALWLARPWLPESVEPWTHWWLGVLALVGGGVGALDGMLFKIVPFLCWLHLKGRLPRRSYVPTMQEFIPEKWQRAHWLAFELSLVGLLAMPVVPAIGPHAGAVFAAQQAALLVLLVNALRVYARALAEGKAEAAAARALDAAPPSRSRSTT